MHQGFIKCMHASKFYNIYTCTSPVLNEHLLIQCIPFINENIRSKDPEVTFLYTRCKLQWIGSVVFQSQGLEFKSRIAQWSNARHWCERSWVRISVQPATNFHPRKTSSSREYIYLSYYVKSEKYLGQSIAAFYANKGSCQKIQETIVCKVIGENVPGSKVKAEKEPTT